jgi:putative transposase
LILQPIYYSEAWQKDWLIRDVELLRQTARRVKINYPFTIDSCVVLPDYLHCLWTLPPNDADFSTRLRPIKTGFSKSLPKIEYLSKTRIAAGERGIYPRGTSGKGITGNIASGTVWIVRP